MGHCMSTCDYAHHNRDDGSRSDRIDPSTNGGSGESGGTGGWEMERTKNHDQSERKKRPIEEREMNAHALTTS